MLRLLISLYSTRHLLERKDNSLRNLSYHGRTSIPLYKRNKVEGKVRAMKKLLMGLLLLLILHTTYYDLTTGTLPSPTVESEAAEVLAPQKDAAPYVVYKINAGDTVLSLVEKANGSVPVAIETIVHDFETLNKIHPTRIQIGKEYKIPTYTNTSAQ
jgi:hypothetical protein